MSIVPDARPTRRLRRRSIGAVLVAVAALAAGCGGDEGAGPDTTAGGTDEPARGGTVVYGLEAETSGGWCLPEAQLAISGIQVARALYDTLTVPDADGNYVPFLAESVTPNATYDEWTVVLRDGITFHDGTPLDATVVKNNLDAYRGAYPARSPLLFTFTLEPIDDVQVVDGRTLTISTKQPWPALPAYLFSSGRFGIMAQAQLDDPETCDSALIGTGPFRLEEWKVNERLVATRNPDYWYRDPATGEQLPYLDSIEFRPIADPDAQVNAFEAGELTAMHTSTPSAIEVLRELGGSGEAELTESDQFAEVGYLLLNVSKPPFDDLDARTAVALGIDRDAYQQIINRGLLQPANGPFAPGNAGHVEDSGFPEHDPEAAKEAAARYEERTGEPLEFVISGGTSPAGAKILQFLQEQMRTIGVDTTIEQVEQAALINTALAGDFQAVTWRNHPGGNPDEQYVWWHSGSPVNFGRIADPELDRLLEAGRVEPDPEAASDIYEQVNRRFGEQLYDLWNSWTLWTIATDPDVGGVYGPQNPDGSDPFPGLATGHPVSGLYVSGG